MDYSALINLAPELLLAFVGMFLLIAAAIMGDKAARKINVAAGLSFILALVFTVYLDGGAALPVADSATHDAFAKYFSPHVSVDAFSYFLKALILVAALAATMLSHNMLRRADSRAEYPVLIIFATLGMMLMVSAQSLLSLYLSLELQSLTLYVLASIRRDDTRSNEAGLKYFVLGALASGLLLYGISMIYGTTGSVNFANIAHALSAGKPPVEAVLGFVFILSAFAFKISAAPFHMWTPDVYEGAPTPITAYFASAGKLAGLGLFIKLIAVPFVSMHHQAQQILILLSIMSMAWGAFAAMAQSSLKRLMAYSSIGHVGYALVGLVAGGEAGIAATIGYLMIYLPMTVAGFAILLSIRHNGQEVEQISDLAGFSKVRPVLAAIMSLVMFSMIGIPPLAGFFGKLYVFTAAVQAGFAWLAVVGVALSVVGAFYYLRIIKVMYFDKLETRFDPVPGWATGLVLAATTIFLLGFIVMPEWGTQLASRAAHSLNWT